MARDPNRSWGGPGVPGSRASIRWRNDEHEADSTPSDADRTQQTGRQTQSSPTAINRAPATYHLQPARVKSPGPPMCRHATSGPSALRGARNPFCWGTARRPSPRASRPPGPETQSAEAVVGVPNRTALRGASATAPCPAWSGQERGQRDFVDTPVSCRDERAQAGVPPGSR